MALSDRQTEIIDRLNKANGVLLSAEITAMFDVTVQTIRKDLNNLSEQGLVRRVHGGIKLPGSNTNVSFNNRTIMNLSAKQNIARKVVEMLPENSSIFLGIGTTPQQVAEALLGHPGLTVVTNNINVALTLCKNSKIQTYLAGGKVRPNDQDLMGLDTTEFLNKFNIQYGIFGVGGFNDRGQLLDFSPEESAISSSIISNSEVRILIADHTKLNRYAPVVSGSFEDVDVLVMDSISPSTENLCRPLDIDFYAVGPEPLQV